MPDHLGCGDAAQTAACRQASAGGQASEKPGGIGVARPGGVHDARGFGATSTRSAPRRTMLPASLRVSTASPTSPPRPLRRCRKIVHLVEAASRPRWRTGCPHASGTSSRNASRCRSTQNASDSDSATCRPAACAAARRRAGTPPGPRADRTVPLQIEDRSVRRRAPGPHVVLAEGDASAEIGVHRPLPVRGDQDQAPRRRRAVEQRRRREMHAAPADVVAEGRPERVVGDLAEEGDPRAERGRHGAGVGAGAAAAFLAGRHQPYRARRARRRSAPSPPCACRAWRGTLRAPAPPRRQWRCRCRECRTWAGDMHELLRAGPPNIAGTGPATAHPGDNRMDSLLGPLARAIAQLGDPVFLGVVWRSVAWSALCFIGIFAGAVWAVHHLFERAGSMALARRPAERHGHRAARALAVPAGRGGDRDVVHRSGRRAVERRYYPALPPAPRRPAWRSRSGTASPSGARILLMNVVALALALLIPGIGLALAWAIAGFAIGRGLFVAVAMRRMSRPEAESAYRRRRPVVLAQGGLMALASYVPLLNLLLPVIGHRRHGARAGRRACIRRSHAPCMSGWPRRLNFDHPPRSAGCSAPDAVLGPSKPESGSSTDRGGSSCSNAASLMIRTSPNGTSRPRRSARAAEGEAGDGRSRHRRTGRTGRHPSEAGRIIAGVPPFRPAPPRKRHPWPARPSPRPAVAHTDPHAADSAPADAGPSPHLPPGWGQPAARAAPPIAGRWSSGGASACKARCRMPSASCRRHGRSHDDPGDGAVDLARAACSRAKSGRGSRDRRHHRRHADRTRQPDRARLRPRARHGPLQTAAGRGWRPDHRPDRDADRRRRAVIIGRRHAASRPA